MIAADAPLQIFDEMDSTNEEARRCATRGEVSPRWLLARRQTSGKGRRGRVWSGTPGNLFLTYLGVTRRPPADIALLGFAAGLALAEFCTEAVGAGRAKLKWPNDLMIDSHKAAGLLLESGAVGDGRNWFAIGIGFNLVSAPSVDQPTICLADVLNGAVPPAPEHVARDLAPRMVAWANIFERDGFPALHAAWTSCAHGIGGPVTASVGAETLTGKMHGLSPRGELLMALPSGQMRAIAAGDIHFPATEAV
jgi:BirA family biotin operon repressor/biotin-[acetyl-CoA-carboxylase] ligase